MTLVAQTTGPLMGVQGDSVSLLPVSFSQEICETPENIRTNIEATLERGYTPFNNHLAVRRDVPVSICGSGPSLKDTYTQVVGDVFACNAATGFLLEKGITPKYSMLWDADKVVAKFVAHHKDIEYLVASRCHEDVFKALEGYNVTVWHAGGDKHIEECLEAKNLYEPMMNGGSAAVTRALFMVYAMGYQEIHVFGGDSSYRNEDTHIKKSVVEEPKTLNIFCHHRWFKTNPWLAVQAEDFKLLAPALRGAGAKIVVHGDGLIPYIAKALEFETPDVHELLHGGVNAGK